MTRARFESDASVGAAQPPTSPPGSGPPTYPRAQAQWVTAWGCGCLGRPDGAWVGVGVGRGNRTHTQQHTFTTCLPACSQHSQVQRQSDSFRQGRHQGIQADTRKPRGTGPQPRSKVAVSAPTQAQLKHNNEHDTSVAAAADGLEFRRTGPRTQQIHHRTATLQRHHAHAQQRLSPRPRGSCKAPPPHGAVSHTKSVWHMPQATTFTSTSPSCGASRSRSSMLNGSLGPRATAARMRDRPNAGTVDSSRRAEASMVGKCLLLGCIRPPPPPSPPPQLRRMGHCT